MTVVRTTHIALRNREEEGASTLMWRVRNHGGADGANRAPGLASFPRSRCGARGHVPSVRSIFCSKPVRCIKSAVK
eukprot:scaffold20743_cov62-Phaeocystis_antarctica.AAC.8